MRRVLGLIFVALALLAGVAALGVWGLARTGPENLRRRAEEQLAGLLGTEVELGPVELRLSRAGLVAAASGLRAWPGPAGPTLGAERLELQLNPWSLLAGQVDLGWVALEGAEVRLRRAGEGLALDHPAPEAAGAERPREAQDAERPAVAAGDPAGRGGLEQLLERVPQLELRRSRVVVAAGPGGAPDLELEDLEGSVARRWIRGGAALALRGALRSAGDASGRFSFEGSAGADGGFDGSLQVDELALGPVASLAPAALRGQMPEGRASGSLEVSGGGGAPLALRFDLDAPRLRLRAPGAGAELRAIRLDGTLTGTPAAGGSTRWRVDGRVGAAGVDAPLAATAVQSASGGVRFQELTLRAPLELSRIAPLLDALPGPARTRLRALAGHVRSGRLLDARLQWRGPHGSGAAGVLASGRLEGVALEAGAARLEDLSGSYALEGGVVTLSGLGVRLVGGAAPFAALWPEAERDRVRGALAPLGGGRISALELRWPLAGAGLADLELRGRVDEARVQVGARSRLEGLAAGVELRGGALALAGMRAELDGRPLPTLDAKFAGIEHLADGVRCVRPLPVQPLPGRRPLAAWVRGPADKPQGPPSWQRVRVEADWLAHPALGCVADDLDATIEPHGGAGGGFRIAIERALWAGLSVAGNAELGSEPDVIRLDLRLGNPGAGARARAPVGIWSRGRFELDSQKLGAWKARSARGRFRLEGDALALEDTTLRLAPGPDVAVSAVELDLSRADAVPFDANAEVMGGDFGDLLLAMSDTPEPAVSGPFVGAISLRGALRPGRPTLGDASGGFAFHVRDGVIRQRFRLFLAVAMASETLNPFRERGTIRFAAMDVEGTLRDGHWAVDTAQIDGPALRVLANGRVGAVSPNPVEGVMALLFFRSVDRAIGAVPLVNRLLLGKDRNLLGTYLALSGPWSAMEASVLPVKSLASGPASVVLEGVPMALQQGVRVLQRVIEVTPTPTTRPSQPSLSPSKEKADS